MQRQRTVLVDIDLFTPELLVKVGIAAGGIARIRSSTVTAFHSSLNVKVIKRTMKNEVADLQEIGSILGFETNFLSFFSFRFGRLVHRIGRRSGSRESWVLFRCILAFLLGATRICSRDEPFKINDIPFITLAKDSARRKKVGPALSDEQFLRLNSIEGSSVDIIKNLVKASILYKLFSYFLDNNDVQSGIFLHTERVSHSILCLILMQRGVPVFRIEGNQLVRVRSLDEEVKLKREVLFRNKKKNTTGNWSQEVALAERGMKGEGGAWRAQVGAPYSTSQNIYQDERALLRSFGEINESAFSTYFIIALHTVYEPLANLSVTTFESFAEMYDEVARAQEKNTTSAVILKLHPHMEIRETLLVKRFIESRFNPKRTYWSNNRDTLYSFAPVASKAIVISAWGNISVEASLLGFRSLVAGENFFSSWGCVQRSSTRASFRFLLENPHEWKNVSKSEAVAALIASELQSPGITLPSDCLPSRQFDLGWPMRYDYRFIRRMGGLPLNLVEVKSELRAVESRIKEVLK